jgi:carboxyl-terminal processing protease
MNALLASSLALMLTSLALLKPMPAEALPQQPSTAAASPEMERLAKFVVGDWDTVETIESSPSFPHGGSRNGRVEARLAAGGYTLIYEVHSDGSAGKLDGFLTIWWDQAANVYHLLACFNNPRGPCRMRGTAHWEGEAFVNDYDFLVEGKRVPWRDTFTFDANSHKLVAATGTDTGTMKTEITTTATRSARKVAVREQPQKTAPEADKLPLEERLLFASRIYRVVSTFFPHLSQAAFDARYAAYLSRIINAQDRRDFDLISMEFVATLHDGHTWFDDQWLEKRYGQPVGFNAYPIDGKWTVVRSAIDALKPGDVITSVEGTPMEQFFADNYKYVSASNDRYAATGFFDTPVIFPERFTMALEDGRSVPIDRVHDKRKEPPAPKTEGRWLNPGRVAYIKVPTFHGIETQAEALHYLREYQAARAVILDLRGNPGAGTSKPLRAALMTNEYPGWMTTSSIKGGLLLRDYNAASPERTEITTTEGLLSPREPIYSGRLWLLIDRECSCACEDFVMPFRIAKRAVLVGETTAGSFSETDFSAFDNGMRLNVASVRHTFPDGSPFEGVGIAPDVEVYPRAPDLKEGRDVVLSRALELASRE